MAMADRGERILSLYLSLNRGEVINKAWAISESGISVRTFERDVEALRACLSDHFTNETLIFDKVQNCYRLERRQLERERRDFQPSEALVLLSVLLESGSLHSDELAGLVDAVIEQLPADQQPAFRRHFGLKIINRPPPAQEHPVLKLLDDLLYVLIHGRYIRAQYRLSDGLKEIILKPLELDYTPPVFHLLAYVWLQGAWRPAALEVNRIGTFTLVPGVPEEAKPAPICEASEKNLYRDLKELMALCQDQKNSH